MNWIWYEKTPLSGRRRGVFCCHAYIPALPLRNFQTLTISTPCQPAAGDIDLWVPELCQYFLPTHLQSAQEICLWKALSEPVQAAWHCALSGFRLKPLLQMYAVNAFFHRIRSKISYEAPRFSLFSGYRREYPAWCNGLWRIFRHHTPRLNHCFFCLFAINFPPVYSFFVLQAIVFGNNSDNRNKPAITCKKDLADRTGRYPAKEPVVLMNRTVIYLLQVLV